MSRFFYCKRECFKQLSPPNDFLHLDDAGLLLQGLLIALRANDADGCKSWLELCIEQLGREVAAEVESDWIVPLFTEGVLYFLAKHSLILRNLYSNRFLVYFLISHSIQGVLCLASIFDGFSLLAA